MYVVWRQRPIKCLGGGAFLMGSPGTRNTDCASPWKPLECRHRGANRVAWTPLLMIAERVDGKPRQRLVYRFPTIRSCCIGDRFNRAAWWYDVRDYLEHVDESYCEIGSFLPRDRAAILAKLREVVSDPSPKGRAEFDAYRIEKEAEARARDDADREWWWTKGPGAQQRDSRQRAEANGWRSHNPFDTSYEEFNAAIDAAFGFASPSCFADLGIGPGTTVDQVKAAYRDLVKIHQPDKGGRAEDFNRIQAAYEQALGLAAKASA